MRWLLRVYTWSMKLSISVSVISSSSSFTSSLFSSVSSLLSSVVSLFSSFFSFFFSLGPGLFGQEFTLNILKRTLISRCFLLLFSWFFSESDLDDSEESFLFNFKESLLSGHENINNFLLSDGDDLMKIGNFSSEYFNYSD